MILVQIFYFFRPYACTICPATFAVDSYLRSHMRSHSGEKRYQCEVCDKKYVSHNQFQFHKKTHLYKKGEIPRDFKCDICEKTFARKGCLQV